MRWMTRAWAHGLVAIAGIGGLPSLVGCSVRDGEACDRDDDCKSGYCGEGLCVGSSCQKTRDCQSGWTCKQPHELVEVFTFGLAKGVCLQSCADCPDGDRYSCSGDLCIYDRDPWVEIVGGPFEVEVGREATFMAEGEAADGRTIASWVWSSSQDPALGEGQTLTRAFASPDELTLRVEATDTAGYSREATAMVTVCMPEGSSCEPGAPCCGGTSCEWQLDDSYRCEPAPICGDGVRTGREECDLDDLGGETCESIGDYTGGTLGCRDGCSFERSGCTP